MMTYSELAYAHTTQAPFKKVECDNIGIHDCIWYFRSKSTGTVFRYFGSWRECIPTQHYDRVEFSEGTWKIKHD